MCDNFEVKVGSVISSVASSYEVLQVLDAGSFGVVTECKKVATNEIMAIKMLKRIENIEEAKQEEDILNILKDHGSDDNIVRFFGSFTFENHFCMEFERLDCNLWQNGNRLRSLTAVQPIMKQLASALCFLDKLGIVHADLKPQNIMMVDTLRQPLRVKVIDFGLALKKEELHQGCKVQTLFYRAPEIILGSRFTGAIDVWSLGCTVFEMLKGDLLFPVFGLFDLMKQINYTIGAPPDHLIDDGMYSRMYFMKAPEGHCSTSRWLIKTSAPMSNHSNGNTPMSQSRKLETQLSRMAYRMKESHRVTFIDLLTECLRVDPAERITPEEILEHPFFTTDLVEPFSTRERQGAEVSVEIVSSPGATKQQKRKRTESPDSSPASKKRALFSPGMTSTLEKSAVSSPGCTPAAADEDTLSSGEWLEVSPLEMLSGKRKRSDSEEDTSSGSPTAKRRTPEELLADKVQTVLADTPRPLLSQPEGSGVQKRKRDDNDGDEEAPTLSQDQSPSLKRARRAVVKKKT